MKEFEGKVAVVTGAASGIGRGLAERFAAEGMRVVVADVEQPALDDAARQVASAGAEVLAVRTDVSKEADVQALAAKTLERFGAVHILCNNAGVGGGGGTSWEMPLVDWEWTLGVNLWGVIHGVRAFVPLMLKGGDEGHIVNTASVAGLIAGAGGPAYTTSKFGVVGLSEMLHHELAQASAGKIKVSVLCPALTNTRILESRRNHPAGPQSEPAEGTPERMMVDMLKGIFAGGMAPAETAGFVVDAIRNERFYVLTHPEHNPRLQMRAEAIVGGGAPPLLMPSP
ncbi:MAG: SDR family NAD(P)-dependent oxidoreductase [Chloroflexi bacterium]|nr:SDR family NAD(P)-dependent oxidoreductase [Chloroflexota bacterium]